MNKIFIVGIVASGKTTLAKRLSDEANIPWYELDRIVHLETPSGRYKRTAAEQVEVIESIDTNGPWIMEGTDRDSYQCLYEMADTIVFLDPPLWKRKIRILTRFVKQKLGIEKCHYKPDVAMLKMMYEWTRNFEVNRNSFEAKLQPYNNKLIKLHDNQNLNHVISCLKKPKPIKKS